jgi:Iap family predicted aminopeptidase
MSRARSAGVTAIDSETAPGSREAPSSPRVGRPNFVDLLGSEIGPRMAGSPEARRASEEISRALGDLGLEVTFQPFEFVGFEPDEPLLEIAGEKWNAAPCPYARAADVGGTLRSIGLLRQEEQDAPVFAIVDQEGNEQARLYSAPESGGAVPTMPVHGAVLGGPAATISARDGRRLAGMGATPVHLRTSGRLVPNMRDQNVVGRLSGEMDEWVVVSCHFDSVWHGPGALDNATGVEGMLQVIERLIDRPRARGVLACAFSAEEIGLLGSRYFVTEARIAGTLPSIVGVVNLDAIGHGDYLEVSVAPLELEGRLLAWVSELDLHQAYPIALRDPLPDADDYPFSVEGIPTVSLVHFPYPEYHSTRESATLVDPARMRDTIALATHMVETQLSLPVQRSSRPTVRKRMQPT